MSRNALTTSHYRLPAENERYFSQGSVMTLFRWGGKRFHRVMANLVRKICTKLYENRPHFVKIKPRENILVFFFGSQF